MNSRERMLAVLNNKEADHIPCCFMSFAIMRKRVNNNLYKLVEAELDMGLDSMLFIPTASRQERIEHPDLRGLPVRIPDDVKTIERVETVKGDHNILHKEYITPVGNLTTSVRLSDDWEHGNHIPFIDDYQIPRQIKPLVTEKKDLEVIKYILQPPKKEDILKFKKEAEEAKKFAANKKVLLAGGWGIGLDLCNWLCGMQNLMMHIMDTPDFLVDLLEIIHGWNLERMKVVLSSPVDIYFRRAWYEGCDFVMPQFYKDAVLPQIKTEVDLAHEYGAKFGYICTCGTDPFLESYKDSGFDVLVGIDPVQDQYLKFDDIRNKLSKEIAIWGGVSAAVTVEIGTEQEIRRAVKTAIEKLGPKNFILSPIDNLTVDNQKTWDNIKIFIDEWKKRR